MPTVEFDPHLRRLIAQYELIGMIWLGKVPDPESGTAHRELNAVREIIGMLEMLERKTRGNVSESEERELRRVLTLLRLNYVEEAGRPAEAPGEGKDAGPAGDGAAPRPAPGDEAGAEHAGERREEADPAAGDRAGRREDAERG